MPLVMTERQLDNLVRRYLAGASVKKLSEELGVGRKAIASKLKMRNVPIRGRSEAELLKWQQIKRNPKRMRKQLIKAWETRRGMKDTLETRTKRATNHAQTLRWVGAGELELIAALKAEGFIATPQSNVGPYNLDLVLHEERIAVEIVTGWIDRAHSIKPERLEYLLNEWNVLVIAGTPVIRPLTNKVKSFIEILSRQPSIVGQYGVIRGNGKEMTSRRLDLNNRPRVVPGF